MADHLKLILLSLTGISFFCLILLFYYFIFPKKKPSHLFLIILISILPIISIFRPGVYESGDFNLHIYRTIAFFNALQDGQFMPSWAGVLNATYGYPLFIFLNPLPYYIISFFHAFHFSYILSTKFFLAFSYIASGIGMYYLALKLYKNKLAAFTAGILYLFAPYHLVDLHFRVDVGEVLFFALYPIYLLTLYLVFKKPKIKYVTFSGLLFASLVLAHQAAFLFSMLITIPFILFQLYYNKKFRSGIRAIIISFCIGIAISFYVIFPHFYYIQFTYAYFVSDQQVTFANLNDLLFSPWRYGFLFQGPKGQLSFLIGYTEIIVLLGGLIIAIKAKKPFLKNQIIFWLVLCCLVIFLILPISAPIWKIMPIIKIIQFTFRLLLPLTVCISLLGGVLILHIKKKHYILLYIFLLITIGFTILNWGNRRTISVIHDDELINNAPMSTLAGEGLIYLGTPKWASISHPWMQQQPKSHIEIVKGKGVIKNEKRNSYSHSFIERSTSSVEIRDNTYFFPGWHVVVDGKPAVFSYTNNTYPDVIFYTIAKGTHYVSVYYEDILIYQIIKDFSLFSFLATVLTLSYCLLDDRKNLLRKKLFNE